MFLQEYGPHTIGGRGDFTNPSGVNRIEKGDIVEHNDPNLMAVAITGCGIAGTAPSTEDGEAHGDVCVTASMGIFRATIGGGASFVSIGQVVFVDPSDSSAYSVTAAGRKKRAHVMAIPAAGDTDVLVQFHGAHDTIT